MLKIEFRTDYGVFAPEEHLETYEITRILEKLTDNFRDEILPDEYTKPILDPNGNKIGSIIFEREV